MAANITSKQSSFALRYGTAIQDLLLISDRLADLKGEYDANGYPPDGTNPNKLTDAVVQAALPHATATQLLQAVGAATSVLTTVSQNRGYLEALRG